VIILDHAATGDGIRTGLMFLKACAELGEDIDTLVDRFPRYPQILENLKISDRERVMSSPILEGAKQEAEKKLQGKGRLLVRPSGTEPLIRILVESRDPDLTKEICREMKSAIIKIGA
jgi:phosphoglucosamine mutase